MSNIVIERGGVSLTIVNGGPSAPSERAESPTPAPPRSAAERFPGVVDGYGNVEAWEAAVYVERLEAFLGRELGEDEADALVCSVSSIRIDNENLLRVLCGQRVMLPSADPRTGVLGDLYEFVTLGEHDIDHWRGQYEQGLAAARRVNSA